MISNDSDFRSGKLASDHTPAVWIEWAFCANHSGCQDCYQKNGAGGNYCGADYRALHWSPPGLLRRGYIRANQWVPRLPRIRSGGFCGLAIAISLSPHDAVFVSLIG